MKSIKEWFSNMKFEKISLLSILFILVVIALLFPQKVNKSIDESTVSPVQRMARIDISNYGDNKGPVVIVSNSDSNSSVSNPTWGLSEDGQITVLKSINQSIDLSIKAVNDGDFQIVLRGEDYRDKEDNNRRIPVCIDYKSFSVNGKSVFSKKKVIWHDSPYTHKLSVKSGEEIKIHLEWEPFVAN